MPSLPKEYNVEIDFQIKLSDFCLTCQPYLKDLPSIENLCLNCKDKIANLINALTSELILKVKKGYWYHTSITECVICGRQKIYKQRRYTIKPAEIRNRYEFHQDACSDHFI